MALADSAEPDILGHRRSGLTTRLTNTRRTHYLVLRSLESEPDRRYQHASEIKEQVDKITNIPAPPSYEHLQGAARVAPEYLFGHWMNGLMALDPRARQQIVQVAAKVLGTLGVLLFIAAGFHLTKPKYAIFGGIACILLAGLVKLKGRKLFTADRDSLVVGNIKLQTALAMSVGPQRDQVLIKVAREAVEEGESKVAELAVDAIRDSQLRDETAASCALRIAKKEGVFSGRRINRPISAALARPGNSQVFETRSACRILIRFGGMHPWGGESGKNALNSGTEFERFSGRAPRSAACSLGKILSSGSECGRCKERRCAGRLRGCGGQSRLVIDSIASLSTQTRMNVTAD